MTKVNGPSGVGGWLLLLCLVLIVWLPLNLGLMAAAALDAVVVHGLPVALVLTARLAIAGLGIAAGLALLACRPAAVTIAKVSMVASAAMDVFVYTTAFFPSNRRPGETPIYIAASLAFYGVWTVYLFRSKRVANTFG